MTATVVLVEDDQEIADIVLMYLHAAGLKTQHFADGVGVAGWVQAHSPALVLLDLDLPTKQGLEVCREIRAFSNLPIIMTTAKVEEVDRLVGLEIGADDYVCKPFSVKELVARVKVQLRRLNRETMVDSGLKVDADSFNLSMGAAVVELTAIEFKLFHLLYSNPNRIYSRAQILDLVYQDYRHVSDRTVDSHIRNVRKKLASLGIEQELIRSIYGAGYKFEPLA
ncbi:response regulator [Shewanella sedimentimangrovi]|uniref:Response regulator n=1 Tax=Shewanella sedimentimangrovi TaxID=2814293 RepID=A0ABX7R153_9GAMM|nr:response regulator [Shewanella sedimentimangrovi]QSX37529.1 response regulator [Shewanella sedimentimangrovi]